MIDPSNHLPICEDTTTQTQQQMETTIKKYEMQISAFRLIVLINIGFILEIILLLISIMSVIGANTILQTDPDLITRLGIWVSLVTLRIALIAILSYILIKAIDFSITSGANKQTVKIWKTLTNLIKEAF